MEQIQTGWMNIDLSDIKTKRKATIRGNEVELLVSPYDIPKAMRAFYDTKTGILTIQFKYLNDEDVEAKIHNEYITYKFGKNSHRVYSLEINFREFFSKAQNQNFTKLDKFRSALNDLTEKPESTEAKDNYEVAKDAMRAREREFLDLATV